MLPRTHFVFGILFTAIVSIILPETSLFYLFLIFLGSFFIDFDHYAASVLKGGKIGLFGSFKYHRNMQKIEERDKVKGIRRKGDFHALHTVEFLIFVFLLGNLWAGFYYIFSGMVFHSILDLVGLIHKDRLYRREFFLTNWLLKKLN